MRFFIIFALVFLTTSLFGYSNHPNLENEKSPYWVCDGYCFLGGDVPVNPFQPVSSSGATEQEARENIDCGPYQETGIVCKEVASN